MCTSHVKFDCVIIASGRSKNLKAIFFLMFHRAFFNSVIDKHQHMHFTFNNIVVQNADFNVKKT